MHGYFGAVSIARAYTTVLAGTILRNFQIVTIDEQEIWNICTVWMADNRDCQHRKIVQTGVGCIEQFVFYNLARTYSIKRVKINN